jgi:tetratricopeptide (TPR) repeat protein
LLLDENSFANGSIFDIARGIAIQLLQGETCRPSVFERLWALRQDSSLSHVSDDFNDPLWSVITAVFDSEKDIVLVVDGLDELNDAESQGKSLLSIIAKSNNAAKSARNTFRCILTTRPLRYAVPDAWEERKISAGDNLVDIGRFVTSKMESTPSFLSLNLEQRKGLFDAILSKSGGMFLWAELTMQQLAKARTINRMWSTLHKTPRELEACYASLLEKVDIRDEDVSRIFQWLLVARQPLTVRILETVLSVECEEEELANRSSTLQDDIKEKCGPLIKVDQGEVGFSHISIRQFLSSKDPVSQKYWSLSASHFEVARTSLKYLSLPLETVPAVMALQVNTNLEARSLYHRILETHPLAHYASSNWSYHLMESGRISAISSRSDIPQEVVDVFPIYQAVCWMEQIESDVELPLSEATKARKFSLAIRRCLLGDVHPESMQSVVNLAQLYEHRSNHMEASTLYQEVWEYCKADLDHQWKAAFESAERFIQMVEASGFGEEAIQICTWTWVTQKRLLGEADTATISTGERLSWILLRHQYIRESVAVEREIWETCAAAHGACDCRTLRAANTLAKSYSLYDAHEASLEVIEKTWRHAKCDVTVDDEVFAKILNDYVQALRACKRSGDATMELVDLMAQISRHDTAPLSWDRRLRVATLLGKNLKQSGDSAKAAEVLIENWTAYESTANLLSPDESWDNHVKLEVLQDLAAGLLKLESFSAAEHVYAVILATQKLKFPLNSNEVVTANLDLANVYKMASKDDKQEEILRSTAEACLALSSLMENDGSLSACTNLSVFHLSGLGDPQKARNIWRELLQKLWPTFLVDLTTAEPPPSGTVAVTVARRLALSAATTGQKALARNVYQKLIRVCPLGEHDMFAIVSADYGSFLCSIGEFVQAEAIYEAYFDHLQQTYGSLDYRILPGAKTLAHMYENKTRNLEKAAKMYSVVLRITTIHHGEWHDAPIEASLAMVRVLRNQGKGRQAEIYLNKLWDGVLNASDMSFTKEIVFQISESMIRMLYAARIHTKIGKVERNLGIDKPLKGKRAAIAGQYSLLLSRHFGGQTARLDAIYLLGIAFQNDGQTEHATTQYELFLSYRKDHHETPSTRRKSRLDADGLGLATDLYVKFYENLEAYKASQAKQTLSMESSVSPQRLTEVLARLAAIYVAQETQTALCRAFDLIRENWKDLDPERPEYSELRSLFYRLASSETCAQCIPSLQASWEAHREERERKKLPSMVENFSLVTTALALAYTQLNNLSALQILWATAADESISLHRVVEAKLVSLLESRGDTTPNPTELREACTELSK